MPWYLAPSLRVLQGEVNARWPDRDRSSDGTIGDAAHAATKSDHNPNERNSVNAWDMTRSGVDPWIVIRAFERHPSAHYWIFDRQIADKDSNWRLRPYTGSNPHTKHVHFSIRQSESAERNLQSWRIPMATLTNDDAVVVWNINAGSSANPVRALDRLNGIAKAGTDNTALIIAAINELRTQLNDLSSQINQLAVAETQRDAELRAMIQAHSDGTISAEQIVARMGELLSTPE